MPAAFEDAVSLEARLLALKAEHRDLDLVLERLLAQPSGDELLLRRLKKRKLLLKDRIVLIERMLEPEEPA